MLQDTPSSRLRQRAPWRVVPLLLGLSLAAARVLTQPASPAPAIVVNSSNGLPGSLLKDEPFVVRVDLPAGQELPDTIQVTVNGPNGQHEPLTLKKTDGGTYVSQTASLTAGAQKTGIGAYLPGAVSRDRKSVV